MHQHRTSLSVVISAKNEQAKLPKQLAAICRGGRGGVPIPDQVVLVDDGSTDGTRQIMRAFAARCPGKVVVIENNKSLGPPAAFNQGAAAAIGDWLYLASANDEVMPGAIDAWREAASKWPESVLMVGDVHGGTETRFFNDSLTREQLKRAWNGLAGASAFIRRDMWNKLGGFPPSLKWYCDMWLLHVIAMRHGCVHLGVPISNFKAGDYSAGNNNKGHAKDVAEEASRMLDLPEFEDVKSSLLSMPAWRAWLGRPEPGEGTDIQPQAPSMPKSCYITSIFGREYTAAWLNTLLKFQIPQLHRRDIFAIITNGEALKMIAKHPLIEVMLRSGIEVSIHDVASEGQTAHEQMAEHHRFAIRRFSGPGRRLVFLSPDVLYATGSFDYLRKAIDNGSRAVCVPMFRATKESMLVAANAFGNAITPRRLVELAVQHQHGMTVGLHWHARNFMAGWPSHLYFATNYGIRGHCWHLHPLAVVMDKPAIPSGTIDKDMLVACGCTTSNIAVATDSDEFCAVELTRTNERLPDPGGVQATIETIASWAKGATTDLDRWFFSLPVRWHSKDLGELGYDLREKEAETVVKAVLKSLETTPTTRR